MNRADESVIHTTPDAPWLPPGCKAEVVRRITPPRPMCVVRLLLRDANHIFCVPRQENGRLDLPMRATAAGDPDGTAAIRALADSIIGESSEPRFLGAVRNIVLAPHVGYEWAVPHAHFGVWVSSDVPLVEGTWVSLGDEQSLLRDRHWYPLVA